MGRLSLIESNFISSFQNTDSFLLLSQVAKEYMNTNLKFALSDVADFGDEIKSLGFENANEEVMVGCLTGKQRFKMTPKNGFESQDLVRLSSDYYSTITHLIRFTPGS